VAATICPRPVTLTFDLLTLKSVWESHVTWGTPVQSFVFLGLLVFELEPMYATSDRQTDDGRRWPLNAPLRGGGITNRFNVQLWVSKTAKMLLERKSLAPSGEKHLIFMLLKVCKWTVISPANNNKNSLKRALLQRKKLHWPRLIWRTRCSNTVTGTLDVDGWAVTFCTARMDLGGLGPRQVPFSLYQM